MRVCAVLTWTPDHALAACETRWLGPTADPVLRSNRRKYLIVLRLGTSCGSSPSPECLIFLSKDMVQGLRKTWVLRPDMVSNSANYWPYPSQAPTPDFKVYTYTTQISINILGTENFHRKPPVAGLLKIETTLHIVTQPLYWPYVISQVLTDL